MAVNVNLQNNVVSAGKFMTVGTSIENQKQVIKNLNSALALESQSSLINSVKDIANGGITADEKIELQSTYNNIVERHQTLQSMVESYRYVGDDWDNLVTDYERVSDEFVRLFSDMSHATDSSDIGTLVERYLNASQSFGVSIRAYLTGIDGYSLELVPSSDVLPSEGTYTVSLRITDPEGIVMTNPNVSNVRWHFSGTANDFELEKKYYGRKVLNMDVEEVNEYLGTEMEFKLGVTLTLSV